MSTLKFGFSYFKKYMKKACLAFFISVIAIIISLMLPQISKYIIDFVLAPNGGEPSGVIENSITRGTLGAVGTYSLLVNLSCIFIGFVVVKAVLQYLNGLFMQKYGNEFGSDLRNDGMKKLLGMNNFSSSGEVYLTVTHDTFYSKELFQTIIIQFLGFVVYALSALVLIFFTHWIIGISMLIIIPIMILLSIKFTKSTTKYFENSRVRSSKLSLAVSEATTAIKDIKTYGYEEHEIDYLQRRNYGYEKNKQDNAKEMVNYQTLFMLSRAVFYAFAIFISGYLAIIGQISIGEFSAAVSYSIIMLDNVVNAATKFYHAEEAFIYLRLFQNFMQTKSKNYQTKSKEKINSLPNISASKATIVLEEGFDLVDLNFEIPYGTKVGFYAPQGEGKSVLAKAFMRFVDCDQGGLAINGVDYREINIDSLREQFAIAPQKPYIFSSSVKNNIILNKPFIEEKYNAILSLVGLADYVDELKEKSDTILQENGAGFPHLESQALSIARCLYNDKPIILLDSSIERFSKSDGEQMLKNIFDYAKEKTVILFTSEPEKLFMCEKIYAIKDGEIIESGIFSELIEKKDGYFREKLEEKEEEI